MNVFKKYLLFLLLFQIVQSVTAQIDILETNKIPNKIPQNLNIYLVIGQSNMAGRTAIREEDNVSIEHCFLFTNDGKTPWVVATNPLNKYSSVRKDMKMQRLSPAFAFAKSMSAGNKNMWVARKGKWKMLGNPDDTSQPDAVFTEKLFLVNLEDDPGEKTNLAEKYPEKVKELEQQYKLWLTNLKQN
jgi:hypothetical protein